MKLVFASDFRVECGTVRTPRNGFFDHSGTKHPPQPFRIVREATRGDWAACIRAKGVPLRDPRRYAFYYEVETD
jgi:hypothetical protein